MEARHRRIKRIRGLQPGYISVVSETALKAVNAKLEAAKDPFAVYDYAEALDALLAILPPEAKARITKTLGIDIDRVIDDALEACERDPYAHPYSNATKCLQELKRDLDKFLRIIFDVAHREGLFVIEKEVEASMEAGGYEV